MMCRVADWAFLGLVFVGVMARAQAPANTSALLLTATSDSAGAIKIDVLRWSTDAERDQLLLAWTRPSAPAPAGGGGGRGGRGRAGAAAAPGAPPDQTADDAQQDADAAPTGAAGRGGAGRGGGGRGGGRGGNAGAEPTAASTPESSLAAALGNAPTVGYLWSAFEVSGYALRYAVRLPAQDGGERIVLVTDRRLGAFNNLWKPTGTGTPANYDFSLIELHLNAKGSGEGRVSLTGKIKADADAKTFALENYGDLPVTLKNVTPRKP